MSFHHITGISTRRLGDTVPYRIRSRETEMAQKKQSYVAGSLAKKSCQQCESSQVGLSVTAQHLIRTNPHRGQHLRCSKIQKSALNSQQQQAQRKMGENASPLETKRSIKQDLLTETNTQLEEAKDVYGATLTRL